MIKSKKFVSTILAGCVALSSLMFSASAVGDPSDSAVPGEIMQFTSVDDETGQVDSIPRIGTQQASGVIWSTTWYEGSGVKVVESATATGDAAIKKEFVKYLTTSWAKASDYTWNKSNSTSWTISSGANSTVASNVAVSLGLSKSRTTTYSVGVTVPANSTKFSKLAFCSDFFRQYYTYKMTVNGTVTKTEAANIKTPTKDTYLIVYYQ